MLYSQRVQTTFHVPVQAVKGNEHQFNFNCGVEDAIASAKMELLKLKPTNSSMLEAVRKAELCLPEGSKALTTQQKHIKITDRSDLSWATVNHYMADLLADCPEDEKEITKSENGARKDLEWAKKKEKRSGSGRRRGYPPRYKPYAEPPLQFSR